MTTPPTPEPSAEALAAETKVADYLWRAGLLNPYNNQTGNELVRIIDAEFAALRARLERAEADPKRLDWLQKHDAETFSDEGFGDGDSTWHCTVGFGNQNDRSYKCHPGISIRAAIDAAMSTPNAKSGEGGAK